MSASCKYHRTQEGEVYLSVAPYSVPIWTWSIYMMILASFSAVVKQHRSNCEKSNSAVFIKSSLGLCIRVAMRGEYRINPSKYPNEYQVEESVPQESAMDYGSKSAQLETKRSKTMSIGSSIEEIVRFQASMVALDNGADTIEEQ